MGHLPAAFVGLLPRWDFEWVKLSGRGEVYSCVMVHHVTIASFANEAPYVIAYITPEEGDEQMRMTTNIVDCAPEDVRVGMPVEVMFDDVTPEITLAKFRPVASG